MRLLNRDLARLDKKLMDVSQQYTWGIMKSDLEEIAELLVTEIQAKTPVRSGQLKASIQILKHMGAFHAKSISYGVYVGPLWTKDDADGSHAHLIEYGAMLVLRDGSRQWMPPQPFIRPTFDQMKHVIMSKMIAAYQRRTAEVSQKFNSR